MPQNSCKQSRTWIGVRVSIREPLVDIISARMHVHQTLLRYFPTLKTPIATRLSPHPGAHLWSAPTVSSSLLRLRSKRFRPRLPEREAVARLSGGGYAVQKKGTHYPFVGCPMSKQTRFCRGVWTWHMSSMLCFSRRTLKDD